jgi:hypothetical protein
MGKIFKASLTDGPRRIMRDAELSQRTLVCVFRGTAFVSEREDDELCIYLLSGGGDNVGTTTLGDRAKSPMTTAKLQQQIVAGRERNAAADVQSALERAGRR